VSALHHVESVPALAELEGRDLGATEWRVIPQSQIDAFADATGDHQWIHVDAERARAESPFGGPIAHGYLTLALAPVLLPELIEVAGCGRVINAGIDHMRLKQPVPAGSRLRLAASVKHVRIIRGSIAHVTLSLRFEIEGEKKPACIADAIYVYYADTALAEE
jgi:acyl dehydratase